MKMKSFTTLLLLILNQVIFAQLTIGTNGKISIDAAEPDDYRSLNIYNSQTNNGAYGIVVRKEGTYYGAHQSTGILGYINSGYGYLKGIYGYAYRSSAISSSRSYGVRGMAGNYTSGWNYGVYGILQGDNNGAGVFGTIYCDISVPGQYAGYFYGNVKVTGSLWASSITESDQRLKKNIESLGNREKSLEKIMKLNPVKYELKNYRPDFGTTTSSDTVTAPQIIEPELLNREHIGFVAQELKMVYPELVYTDGEGIMGINYTQLIPILVQAIQEQQEEIEELKNKLK